MATNSESAVCLQFTVRPNTRKETDSLLPHDHEATDPIPSCHCKLGYQARKVRSKGAVLVIVWSMLTWACHYTSVNVEVVSQFIGFFNFGIVFGVVMAVLYIFAGWLADVYFGRYKVMKISILVMWLGSVGSTLLLLIHLLSPHDVLKYISVVVAYIGTAIGWSGLMVNAIPFGTDQMLGASSDEISAFIHWFV